MRAFFVTGIGTDIGKTVACAVLVEALRASYWKPVQAGSLEHTDSDEIRRLTSESAHIFPERYRLKNALSPHAAAEAEQITIRPEDFILPGSTGPLIIEGAGGLMVPLNPKFLVLDLILKLKVPVILVSRYYLGSINHTLLSLEVLRSKGISVVGIILNGTPVESTKRVVCEYANAPLLGEIGDEPQMDSARVQFYVEAWTRLGIEEKLLRVQI